MPRPSRSFDRNRTIWIIAAVLGWHVVIGTGLYLASVTGTLQTYGAPILCSAVGFFPILVVVFAMRALDGKLPGTRETLHGTCDSCRHGLGDAGRCPECGRADDLHSALERRAVDRALELLESGADPHEPTHYGYTPLQVASQHGLTPVVRRLLKLGADPNARCSAGVTSLKLASAEPSPATHEIVRLLLDAGAMVDLADDRGFTPLHCAAGHGRVNDRAKDIAATLLAAGADPNARSHDPYGYTPLHEVSTAAMVRLLLDAGADPSIRSNAGQTPREKLIEDGCEEEARALRSHARRGT